MTTPAAFFGDRKTGRFFKRKTPTSGTYLECWARGIAFSHHLATVELNSDQEITEWLMAKGLRPCTEDDWDEYFFQFCREVDWKREKASAKRQRTFEQKLEAAKSKALKNEVPADSH